MKDSRRGLEILNEVPHADEMGCMTQAPPAEGRPSSVTTLDSFSMQGTRFPLEKLTGLTTVQTDPNLSYYLMSGMEYAQGSVGAYSSYSREYVNHEFGGELSYGIQSTRLHSVNALSFSHGTEYAYGHHTKSIAHDYEEGYADQYSQELITERDGAYTTQYWRNKMTYRKRYQLKKTDVNFHYRLSFVDGDAVAAYAGIFYDLQSVSNKHLLATSQLKYTFSQFGIEGGYGFFAKRLWLKGNADYHVSHKADLNLNNEATDYAQGVLLPDMEYYRANYWQGRIELTYQQPLTIKGRQTLWFAKLYGSYLKTDNSLDGKGAGVSVGLYY